MASFMSVLILASLLISSNAIRIKDCGSMHGKVRSVTVAGCDNTPCLLRTGTDVSLTVDFTSCKCNTNILIPIYAYLCSLNNEFSEYSGRNR